MLTIIYIGITSPLTLGIVGLGIVTYLIEKFVPARGQKE